MNNSVSVFPYISSFECLSCILPKGIFPQSGSSHVIFIHWSEYQAILRTLNVSKGLTLLCIDGGGKAINMVIWQLKWAFSLSSWAVKSQLMMVMMTVLIDSVVTPWLTDSSWMSASLGRWLITPVHVPPLRGKSHFSCCYSSVNLFFWIKPQIVMRLSSVFRSSMWCWEDCRHCVVEWLKVQQNPTTAKWNHKVSNVPIIQNKDANIQMPLSEECSTWLWHRTVRFLQPKKRYGNSYTFCSCKHNQLTLIGTLLQYITMLTRY